MLMGYIVDAIFRIPLMSAVMLFDSFLFLFHMFVSFIAPAICHLLMRFKWRGGHITDLSTTTRTLSASAFLALSENRGS